MAEGNALKPVEVGRNVEDLARECVVSKHTIYARSRTTPAQ
jgi:hypothetical protein